MTTSKLEELASVSKDLMLLEPFYGMFLIMLNKEFTEQVPTAGVGTIGINYNLYINPKFWDSLTQKSKRGLLKHELLHIGFFHLTDFNHLTDKEVANLAKDCEINQYIAPDDLPPNPVLPSVFPELDLKPKMGTNYYYEKMMKGMKKCPNLAAAVAGMKARNSSCTISIKGKDQELSLPDHSKWGEIQGKDEATQKLINRQVEFILKEVAEQTIKSRGTIPGEFAEILERINKIEEPKFDWKGYLRRFVGGSQKVYTKKSRRKLSKRFPGSPGLKIKPKRHVLIGVDTSGSVSTSELKEFFNEVHHIHKNGSDVTVVQCDAAISDVSPFKPNMDIKIHGRGGTDFQPVIDYYNEHYHKFTCLVYFTDGECSAPTGVRGKTLWVLSSNSTMNDSLPGSVIKLN
jgi:predicted metal-dependent peptidase